MKQEAAKHEAEDKQKAATSEAKYIAEQLIYTSEKSLKDAGDKVPADIKKGVEDKITALKTAKDAQPMDAAAVKTATEALSTEIQKIGQFMNQQAGQGGAQGAAGQQGAQNGSQNGNGGTDGN